jgi:hypothetical protein
MRSTIANLTAIALLAAAPVAASAQSGTATGAAGGAIAGAIAGGPVGAAVGGVIGAIVGTAIQPPPQQVVTWVATQSPPPVVLQGNLVVGATLPPTVVLYPVPVDIYVPADSHVYAYAIVNGQHVVVDANTRAVVAIVG